MLIGNGAVSTLSSTRNVASPSHGLIRKLTFKFECSAVACQGGSGVDSATLCARAAFCFRARISLLVKGKQCFNRFSDPCASRPICMRGRRDLTTKRSAPPFQFGATPQSQHPSHQGNGVFSQTSHKELEGLVSAICRPLASKPFL
jgi:hypothetical protein